MSETINGLIDRVYFATPTFSAGVIDAGSGVKVKFRGKFHAVEGESVSVQGAWEKHPKYGHQFAVQGLAYELPETRVGLMQYLASNPAFRGIGEANARKLVDYAETAAGLEALLGGDLEALNRSLRIPLSTLEGLREAWRANAKSNAVRTYLSGFELTPHQIDTLLDRFGEGVVGILKADPYELIRCVPGYGFKRVDEIARKTGVPKNHPGRIRAGVLNVVHEEIGNGHTWIDAAELVRKANDLLILDDLDSLERVKAAGKGLVESGDLIASGSAITTQSMYEAEKSIASAFAYANSLRGISVGEIPHTNGLHPAQARAFNMAWSHAMSAISGGAGTGKTFVVARLAKSWTESGKSVCLCAPTGKAAKRIEEVLRTKHGIDHVEAKTMHRLLGYDGRSFHTERIEEEVIIVDEVSMVDVLLFAEFLQRVDLSKTQVVLVGDHNQLPPVGPGNILRDIMAKNLIPVVVLDQVVRNAGPIERASAEILQGRIPGQMPDEHEWAVVEAFREPEQIVTYVRDLVLTAIPKHLGYDPVRDVQILSPTHKGPLGTRAINSMMQYLLRGPVDGRFAVGDKVIQTANDYTLGVMNGTIGFVEHIDRESFFVHFDGEGLKEIPREKQGNLQLAYVLTAHKAQGSEFPCVVVLCHKSHFFTDRNWLYTAVTRAAKHVIVLGDRWGLWNAAKKNDVVARRTLLSLWCVS